MKLKAIDFRISEWANIPAIVTNTLDALISQFNQLPVAVGTLDKQVTQIKVDLTRSTVQLNLLDERVTTLEQKRLNFEKLYASEQEKLRGELQNIRNRLNEEQRARTSQVESVRADTAQRFAQVEAQLAKAETEFAANLSEQHSALTAIIDNAKEEQRRNLDAVDRKVADTAANFSAFQSQFAMYKEETGRTLQQTASKTELQDVSARVHEHAKDLHEELNRTMASLRRESNDHLAKQVEGLIDVLHQEVKVVSERDRSHNEEKIEKLVADLHDQEDRLASKIQSSEDKLHESVAAKKVLIDSLRKDLTRRLDTAEDNRKDILKKLTIVAQNLDFVEHQLEDKLSARINKESERLQLLEKAVKDLQQVSERGSSGGGQTGKVTEARVFAIETRLREEEGDRIQDRQKLTRELQKLAGIVEKLQPLLAIQQPPRRSKSTPRRRQKTGKGNAEHEPRIPSDPAVRARPPRYSVDRLPDLPSARSRPDSAEDIAASFGATPRNALHGSATSISRLRSAS